MKACADVLRAMESVTWCAAVLAFTATRSEKDDEPSSVLRDKSSPLGSRS